MIYDEPNNPVSTKPDSSNMDRKRGVISLNNVTTTKSSQNDQGGEESVSGSAPSPDSDNDLLENAHAVGEQLEESDSMEHPEEIDIARDINEAEEYIKTH